jgi:hypothetical protein
MVSEFKNPYFQVLTFNIEFGTPVFEACMFSYIYPLMCCEIKYDVFYQKDPFMAPSIVLFCIYFQKVNITW